MQRGNFGEERYEKIDFQKKVREQFLALRDEDSGTGSGSGSGSGSTVVPWHIINAQQSIEEVHKEITAIVDAAIAESGSKPISKLWLK